MLGMLRPCFQFSPNGHSWYCRKISPAAPKAFPLQTTTAVHPPKERTPATAVTSSRCKVYGPNVNEKLETLILHQ